jgi:hypothetical protein
MSDQKITIKVVGAGNGFCIEMFGEIYLAETMEDAEELFRDKLLPEIYGDPTNG